MELALGLVVLPAEAAEEEDDDAEEEAAEEAEAEAEEEEEEELGATAIFFESCSSRLRLEPPYGFRACEHTSNYTTIE